MCFATGFACEYIIEQLHTFDNLGNYFVDLQKYQKQISDFFESIVLPSTIEQVPNEGLTDCIAVHVRLGDYLPHLRVPIEWYKNTIESILDVNPSQKFIVFSDGSDKELEKLLSIHNVKRVFYGNAFADIYAISKCKMVIASDSTFSAWGAFLGNVPVIFNKRHFPAVYDESTEMEWVLPEGLPLPDKVTDVLLSK